MTDLPEVRVTTVTLRIEEYPDGRIETSSHTEIENEIDLS